MTSYPGEDPQQESSGHQPADQPAEAGDAATGDTSGNGETEPTQPVGYWERQAAEQARHQTQQGDPDPAAAQGEPVLNPTTAQPAPGGDQGSTQPYEQDPSGQAPYQSWGQPEYGQPGYPQPGNPQPGYPQQGYPQSGYPQQGYGQPTYGQPAYGQPAYGQPPYGPPPAYGYPAPGGPSTPFGSGHPGYPPYAAFSPALPQHSQATIAMVLGIIGLVGGVLLCGVGLLASPFAWALGRNATKEIEASQGRLGGAGAAKAGTVLGIIGTILLVVAVIALIGLAILLATSDTSGSNI